eukprot:1993468-Pyramimonas_sp.AAC.1
MSDATRMHFFLGAFSSKASMPRQNISVPWTRAFFTNMSVPKAWMVESSTMSASPKRGHLSINSSHTSFRTIFSSVVAKEQPATMLRLTDKGRDKASPTLMLRGPP